MSYPARQASMKDTAQAVADAHEVVVSGLPGNVDPLVRAAVCATVLRQFLATGYARDLTVSWTPERLP